MTVKKVYSVDTSALLDGLERYYPQVAFPALWDKVDGLVAEGRFFVSEEVWEEARVHDAATKLWLEGHPKDSIVVPTDVSIAAEVQEILGAYPKLVANMKGRNRADAFVIAVARKIGGVVVTGEGSDGNENRPKIPFICINSQIECIRFIDIIRLEGWKF
ncbi:DUF4411 family protein [Streptomyces sp. f51]|uniref:DUF4411 family protein n=1 Tax=Streptomyces sp. f51 TaxID=1827742 RepID=UPI000BEF506E|nr:DUF4411 family protein [Streptomyces sp. f51]